MPLLEVVVVIVTLVLVGVLLLAVDSFIPMQASITEFVSAGDVMSIPLKTERTMGGRVLFKEPVSFQSGDSMLLYLDRGEILRVDKVQADGSVTPIPLKAEKQ